MLVSGLVGCYQAEGLLCSDLWLIDEVKNVFEETIDNGLQAAQRCKGSALSPWHPCVSPPEGLATILCEFCPFWMVLRHRPLDVIGTGRQTNSGAQVSRSLSQEVNIVEGPSIVENGG